MHPVGIGETLRQALVKIVMRADGYQANTACGNQKLCAGLEAGIESATHAVEQRRLERERQRRGEKEVRRTNKEEDEYKAARKDR